MKGSALLLAGLTLVLAARASALTLVGLSGRSSTITTQEIAALPHVTVKAVIEGQSGAYSGPLLHDLLARIDAPSGRALKGLEMTDVVILRSRDGYAAVLSLAETDPAFRAERVILANSLNGDPLPDKEGPYRLIIEGDLRGARMARMVDSIEVRRIAP